MEHQAHWLVSVTKFQVYICHLVAKITDIISLLWIGHKLYSFQDACLLGSLEDGLNALLCIEVSLLQ